MERGLIKNREVELHTTLSELERLLKTSPKIFGDQVKVVQGTVEKAKQEIQERGNVSPQTTEELDNLHRPFK